MIMEYYIVGGQIRIQKAVFTMEMLKKDSSLRALLHWKGTRDFGTKHPAISEPDAEHFITIQFSSDTAVHLEEHPQDLLGRLKAELKDKIMGKVSCRSEYSLFGGIYSFEIDLDHENS